MEDNFIMFLDCSVVHRIKGEFHFETSCFCSDNDMVASELQGGLLYCVSWANIPCISNTTVIQRAHLPAHGTSVTQEQPMSVQTDVLEENSLKNFLLSRSETL